LPARQPVIADVPVRRVIIIALTPSMTINNVRKPGLAGINADWRVMRMACVANLTGYLKTFDGVTKKYSNENLVSY
jgi:hypothetical protein